MSTARSAPAATRQTTVDLEVVGFYRKVKDLIVDVDDGTARGTPSPPTPLTPFE